MPEGPLRLKVLNITYDDPLAGHFGFARIYELASREFYWPNIRVYIKEYVKGCTTCRRVKPATHRPYGLLYPEKVPYEPWSDISMDFVIDLPPSEFLGVIYNSILVIIDRFTKMAYYVLTKASLTLVELADTLRRECFRLYGYPKSIVSDRGLIIISKFWSSFCFYLGVRRKLSTAFHP